MTGEPPHPSDGNGDRDDGTADSDRPVEGTADEATADSPTTGGPIDGQALVLAAAKASVAADRLPGLVDRAAAHLRGRRERYRSDYERVHADGDRAVYLVEDGHWEDLGAALGFTAREAGAVSRAHEEQLRRIGRRTGRGTEFDHALEIRAAVVVGRDGSRPPRRNGQR